MRWTIHGFSVLVAVGMLFVAADALAAPKGFGHPGGHRPRHTVGIHQASSSRKSPSGGFSRSSVKRPPAPLPTPHLLPWPAFVPIAIPGPPPKIIPG
jgi:hypothetical protein